MEKMLNVGIIGAGTISCRHLNSYRKLPDVQVKAICDRNPAIAELRAKEYGIPAWYTDAEAMLRDSSIDAVSIVTPTFTHKDMVLLALAHGKHVLCEKPPALNAHDVQVCAQAAKEAGKLLMFGFVVRFNDKIRFLREYADAGNMGNIYYAEVSRVTRCSSVGGWFSDKSRSGGGMLIDGAIHEIDAALYIMGYPKVKSVSGTVSMENADLPDKAKGLHKGYTSSDTGHYVRTIESAATGYVRFENGACMYIKAANILNTLHEGRHMELCGTKAGAEFTPEGVKLVSVTEDGYFLESSPVLNSDVTSFDLEIPHFVDCCLNGSECVIKPEQAVQVMKIIDAIYASAQTGKEIIF